MLGQASLQPTRAGTASQHVHAQGTMPAEVLRLAGPRMATSASTWLRSFWARAGHLDPSLESAQPGLARDARGVQQQPIPRKEGVTKKNLTGVLQLVAAAPGALSPVDRRNTVLSVVFIE